MSGIAGAINCRDINITNVFESLARRGPDENGYWNDDQCTLINSRLAIIDKVNGKQPMVLEHGRDEYILVYNGEIFNAPDLRNDLVTLGHSFIGNSDTEVLLHAYAEWRDKCLERLNGMFAFAIWECKSKRLFIARDRTGAKPLFFSNSGTEFRFGSEIKTLLALGVEPEIDSEGIAELILLSPGRTSGKGVFRTIEELKPGWCGYVSGGDVRLRRYWALIDREHKDSFKQTVEHVRELVLDSINRQLISDAPLCTFLSGGLDSSTISSVVSMSIPNLHTFSVDYANNDKYFTPGKFQPESDTAFISKMNEYLGESVTHHSIILSIPELADALYEAVDARDLPGMADVDSSLLLFCREVKKHVDVALSGEGADEIFGGYPWYRDPTIRARDGFPWAQSTEYRSSFMLPEFNIDAAEFVNSRYRYTVEAADVLPGTDAEERRIREMMRLNLDWFMQTLIDRKDRMSMYSGLEARMPFADHRIIEYLYSIPWEIKDFQGREKGLLREAVRGLLPVEVLWRKKSPYPKTHSAEYLDIVAARLKEVMANKNAPIFQIVNKSALEALVQSGDGSPDVPWYGQLMMRPQTIAYFLQLNYWLEKYRVRIV